MAGGLQGALDGLRLSRNDLQKHRSGAAHLPPSLLPFPIAGQTHAHQRSHLCLGELDLLSNFTPGQDRVNSRWTFALGMRQRFVQGLNQFLRNWD